MRRQGLLSLSGIILLSLIVMMTLHEWDDVVTGTTPEEAAALPTLELTGVSGQRFDASGTRDFQLKAATVTWLESTEDAHIEAPELALSLASGDWLISANRGGMDQLSGSVTLEGDVLARLDGPGAMRLESDRLTYNNSTQALSSPGPVRLRHQDGTTRAGALSADMASNILTFTGGVETQYVQP